MSKAVEFECSHVFVNNSLNNLNYPVVSTDTVIDKDTKRFKDGFPVYLEDGIYYLDESWQHIQIKNNLIVTRVHNGNPKSMLPTSIFTNEYTNTHIDHYMINPIVNQYHKNHIFRIPLSILQKACDFIDIIHNSGYDISKPYEFDVIKGNQRESLIRLIKGHIYK